MWSDQTILVWIGVIWIALILQNGVEGNDSCPSGFFRCLNGECIDAAKHCDGHQDCKDNFDEFDCDVVTCKAPDWFRCITGRCVTSSVRCDGSDDCGDWSDEEDCSTDATPRANCSLGEWRCIDNNCILGEWVCDGKQDCMDGSDELHGCTLTMNCTDGFLCDNRHCIPNSFFCDGSDDCGDNSDESHCPKNQDIPPEKCVLERNLFLCADKRDCVQVGEMCDGVEQCRDGSDEGPACNASIVACHTAGCNHRCVSSANGPLCICQIGYELNNKTCVDKDECMEYGICDQRCKNLQGSYECYCDEGYVLASDKHSCKAAGADALLLFSTTREIRGLYINKKVYYVIAKNLDHVVGVSYDGMYIYWTHLVSGEESIMRSREDGSDVEDIVDAGLYQPEDLTVDWVTGNIYFTDIEAQHIGVCSNNGSFCTVLITKDIDKPRSIIVLPAERLMFWTDWGTMAMIGKAGMDGSNPEAFISTEIDFPNGITIDYHNSRLYWVDSKRLVIESANLDGSDRKVVLRDVVKHPYAVAVFEDTLYWSDWHGRDIQACHKFTGKNHRVIIREKSKGNFIYGIHIYHPAMMPSLQNPCKNVPCSGICVLSPNESYACACGESQILGADKHTCYERANINELMVAAGGHKFLVLGQKFLGKRKMYEMSVPRVHTIGALTYNSLRGCIIIFDSEQSMLFTLNIIPEANLQQLTAVAGTIDSMDFDYMGNNLYWCDSEKGTVEIMSLTTLRKTILLHSSQGEAPVDIAVVPDKGIMFVAFSRHFFKDSGPHIDRLDMNGKGNRIHMVETGLGGSEISLLYDQELQRIFWSDPHNEEISSAALDGTDQHKFRSYIDAPNDISSLAHDLFWTHWGLPFIYWVNKYNARSRVKQVYFETEVDDLKLVALRSIRTKPDHPCHDNIGGCSHICAVIPKHRVCLCPIGMKLNSDNRTCSAIFHCSADMFKCNSDNMCIPVKNRCDGKRDCPHGEDELGCMSNRCPNDQFTCNNGQCVSITKKCNGKADCLDGSDEFSCIRDECDEVFQFTCMTGECIMRELHCDGEDDCVDGSDEDNCFENTCGPDEFRCAIGQCIPDEWLCDGQVDCTDDSDEHNCPPLTCAPEAFSCKNGHCIDKQLLCNDVDDCGDRSDEDTCKSLDHNSVSRPCFVNEFPCMTPTGSVICVPLEARCNNSVECPMGEDEKDCDSCEDHEFRCNNGRCIKIEWVCDGLYDCDDGSDEDNSSCNNQQPTKGTTERCREYSCKNGECIAMSLVCNKEQDCRDGSDEGGQCDTSCGPRSTCKDICHPTPGGPICACSEGFFLLEDRVGCADIDECEDDNACAQVCHNTQGSFSCTCDPGFRLRSDHISCKAVGEAMQFIFSMGHQIRKVSHDLRSTEILNPDVELEITGLDVDSELSEIYWSTDVTGTISRMSLHGGNRTHITGILSPGDIALDWITKNVYYLEKRIPQTIQVFNLDGKHYAKVTSVEEDYYVSKIAVDPIAGYLFWVEVSNWVFDMPTSDIFRCDLDGRNRTNLVKLHFDFVTGLALDMVRRKIYIADQHKHYIESISYEGSNRTIIADSRIVQNPTDLALFEGILYWLNGGTEELNSYKPYGPQLKRTGKLQLHIPNAAHFAILQPSAQPRVTNPCANHSCSEICVLTPGRIAACLCSDGTVVEKGEACPSKKGDEVGKDNEKMENKGSSIGVILTVIFVIIIIVVLLFGAYHYRHLWYRGQLTDFIVHFQNPSFGLQTNDGSSQELLPGQHQYTNPMEGSEVSEDPEGTVVTESCSHEGQASVTQEVPQQSAEHPESEDTDIFVRGRKDITKVPLIPYAISVGSL